MKRITAFLLITTLLMASFSLPFAVYAADVEINGEYVLDEIIIKFYPKSMFPGKEKQYDDEVNKVLKDGLSIVSENIYVVKSEDFKKNPNATLNKYKNSAFIEYVEPNYKASFDEIPNDPNYKTLSASLTAMNAQAGWDITTGKGSPIIAIVDSGVASHTDLPKSVSNYSAVTSLSAASDTVGHGTGVAGTAGMIGDNSVGGAGINWNAQIMNVKVDDASGTLTVANIAKGVIWAADNGAKVINLSLGTTSDSTTLKNAIDYAYNKGCAIFAATGNESSNTVCYPARYANVMGIGSTTNGTSRAASSNYGAGLDVVAVGGYYTSSAKGGYANSSGTSFASPQAAALASLMWAVNPNLTNAEIYTYIRQNAKPLGGGINDQTGYGLIDIGKTLEAVKAKMPSNSKPPQLYLIGPEVVKTEQGIAFMEPGYKALDGNGKDITSQVVVEGKVDSSKPGTYTLTYKITDAGQTVTISRRVEVQSNEPPQIWLKGEAEMVLAFGERFLDPGVFAIDNAQNNITDSVAVFGTVDSNQAGSYILTYRAMDSAGRTATADRKVIVNEPSLGDAVESVPELPVGSAPSVGLSFITEAATGTRNDYNGSVGYEFECLSDMTVSSVGRPLNGAMNNAHKIYIWEVKTLTLLATAEVKADSPLDSLGFKVAPLNKTVTFKAGEKYRIVSAEATGGDKWYDVSQTYNLVPTQDCRITTPVHTNEGAHTSYPGNTYNPGGIKGYTGVTFYYELEIATQPEPVLPNPEPPQLQLRGEINVEMVQGASFSDPGYVATSYNGEDISAKVTVDGIVNSNTPGTYILSYKVTDFGFTVTETRNVTVKSPAPQPEPPKLQLHGDGHLEMVQGASFSEPGYVATSYTGEDISAKVTVEGAVNSKTPGTYTLTYKIVDSGFTVTETRSVTVNVPAPQPEPPKLQLMGSEEIYLEFGQRYEEQGYAAYSYSGEEITSAVKVEGSVDSNSSGFYILTYKVTDSGFTVTVNRSVWVKDAPPQPEPPVLVLHGSDMVMEEGFSYDEPGYYANSYTGDDITSKVRVEGFVDSFAPGLYTLTYSVEDSGFTARETRKVTVNAHPEPEPDRTPPEISIIGSQTIVLYQGHSYTEQGATAYDDVDGNLSYAVEIGGDSVDANYPGNYTVTYTISDSSGNTAQTERQVRVIAPEERYDRSTLNFSGAFKNKNDSAKYHSFRMDGEGSIDVSVSSSKDTLSGTLSGPSASASNQGNSFSLYAPNASGGNYDLQLAIKDGNGNSYNATVTMESRIMDFAQPEVPLGTLVVCEVGECKALIDLPKEKDLTEQDRQQGYVMVICQVCGHEQKVALELVLTPPPLVTIVGSPIVVQQQGQPYRDQGAVAYAVNGEVLSEDTIVTWGYVDVNTPGWYSVSYTVADDDGRIAKAERIVRIVGNDEAWDHMFYQLYGSLGGKDIDGNALPKSATKSYAIETAGQIRIVAIPSSGGAQKGLLTVTLKDSKGNVLATGEDFNNFIVSADILYPGDYTVEFSLSGGEYVNYEVFVLTELEPQMEATFATVSTADAFAISEAEVPLTDFSSIGGANQPAADTTTYSVASGDTLWLISEKQYGDGTRWQEIYDLNKAAIGNDPSQIYIGQVLTLNEK